MADKTGIQWTGSTWTPIRARVKDDAVTIAERKGYSDLLPLIQPGRVGPHCEKISTGCVNCYSETNNGRCLPHNGTGLPFTRRARDLVDMFVDEKILTQPLRWRAPRKVFVCSQTDLFGEFVPDEFIDRVFAVMALCQQHTFQVLTKRAERMAAYLASRGDGGFGSYRADGRYSIVGGLQAIARAVETIDGVGLVPAELRKRWPLPNVWCGVSCERQQEADERIPHLLRVPAAVRFLSCEPLLGPVDLTIIPYQSGMAMHRMDALNGYGGWETPRREHRLGWVIVGGESGHGARPMNLAWARGIVEQCKAASVPVFVKQLGACPTWTHWTGSPSVPIDQPYAYRCDNPCVGRPKNITRAGFRYKKGGDPSEWPEDLRVREFPTPAKV